MSVLNANNHVEDISREQCNFVYGRFFHSGFSTTKDIIIQVRLELVLSQQEQIRKQVEAYSSYRKKRSVLIGNKEVSQPIDPYTGTRPGQPTGASAGCVFYNSPNQWDHPTGRMIDMCGLKGLRIGGAQISEQHANYVVNVGQAKASDIRHLIELSKEAVMKQFGIELVEEIEYVGEW